jgi:hypothetical protein
MVVHDGTLLSTKIKKNLVKSCRVFYCQVRQYGLIDFIFVAMPARYRLTVYFSDDTTLKKLEEWAKEENRSASNLAATLLNKAVQEKESKHKPST